MLRKFDSNHDSLLYSSRSHCQRILKSNLLSKYPYHNYQHTLEVVKACIDLCSVLSIDQVEASIVEIAAWFHDLGYIERYKDHESTSIAMAKNFLLKQTNDQGLVREVVACINATRMPQKTSGILQDIIADADLAHLGQDNYFYRSILLRREWELFKNLKYPDLDWHFHNRNFLRSHHYKTEFYIEKVAPIKLKNADKIESILKYY
ncbi:MAG: hypothetical protein ACI9P5_002851 [Saprospiraceae bacterium]|jgi:uncharacterized protein|tara:strand:+ start:1135 stop:1752 length:618 start_codon:yes stop_codon:yes gene_type:complete